MQTKHDIISRLKNALLNNALKEIKIIANSEAKISAFILLSCFIEYIAGFRYGKTSKDSYTKFVAEYLKKYIPKKLKNDLRNKIVHNYSEGGTYALAFNKPHLHLSIVHNKRVLLNLEDFLEDIENAALRYFNEMETNSKIFELAKKRYSEYGILGYLPIGSNVPFSLIGNVNAELINRQVK